MNLPVSYMKVARDLTGYWGTYLPSLRLEPGTIGFVGEGRFDRQADLTRYAHYSRDRFKIENQPDSQATTVWNSESVRMDVLGAKVSAPGVSTSGAVRLSFGRANEASIICSAVHYTGFADILMVHDLMRTLRRSGDWDDGLCVVVELVTVRSAWIAFSTAANQEAHITAKAPLALPADPTGALTQLAGSAEIEASHTGSASQAFCATLPDGGTPLFRAIRFNPNFFNLWGMLEPGIRAVRGDSSIPEFEEPEFGIAETAAPASP